MSRSEVTAPPPRVLDAIRRLRHWVDYRRAFPPRDPFYGPHVHEETAIVLDWIEESQAAAQPQTTTRGATR